MRVESVYRRKGFKEKLDWKLVEQTTTTGPKGIVVRDIPATVKQLASEDELMSMELEIRRLIQKNVAHLRRRKGGYVRPKNDSERRDTVC